MNANVRSLIEKLSPSTRTALEGAAGLCLARTHYDVEVEHFLLKLLDAPDGDAPALLRHFGADRARLAADLSAGLDRLRAGNARTPALSPSLVRLLAAAWTAASLDYGDREIRGGHTLVALVADDELARLARSISRELDKLSPEALRRDFASIVHAAAGHADDPAHPSAVENAEAGPAGRTPNLDRFTVDLTARARAGELDPVLGRDAEVRQVIDILTRRRQNNPILVGEAGVGKTAVVEGFALRVAAGDVPPALRGVSVRTLDLALLQAGAGIKGEFENRLKGLIEEARGAPQPVILFIDEAHTMIGAGGAAGQGDAANLLKPALARGELRTLAATTWPEYKKYFEKDAALARRFQLVKVDEPSEDACLVMMRGLVPALERHHGVRVLDEGVRAAVRLSRRYLPDRQLPDKAVSVLDTACARLALGRSATPGPVEDARRRVDDLAVQARVLGRERAAGADHDESLAAIARERALAGARLAEAEARWSRESALAAAVREARARLEATADAPVPGGDPAALRAELDRLSAELRAVQGDAPLVPVCVDAALVGAVIGGWTGIPAGTLLRDDLETALALESHLARRIVGQEHALRAISRRVRTARAGVEDPGKPVGVFLLAGPSGVGKTETALALSELLYGGEQNLVTINLSEFQEPHTVSTLKGSPPGYVGYGEGGVLTEAVRRRPYCVVLLDEAEKAHPDVLELFYQLFDKGTMEDGEGRQVDFRNCLILLATNAGSETILRLTADPETAPDADVLARALKPELDRVFKPAFLGRTVIVPYFSVRDEALRRIVALKVDAVRRRLGDVHRIALLADDAVIDAVAARCTEVESGARTVDNLLTHTLLPEISRIVLRALADGERPAAIRVEVDADGALSCAPADPSPGSPASESSASPESVDSAGSMAAQGSSASPGPIGSSDPSGSPAAEQDEAVPALA